MTRKIDHARVRELFELVCDLPTCERSVFLDRACADDPALRDEVRSLLDYDTDGDDALADGSIDRGESLGFLSPGNDEPLPERFGAYRIIRLLGAGGMGEVYEAEQDSPRRRVALKIMHAAAASRQMKRRFHMESEIQGLLRHPGIAQVYETGIGTVHGRQVPYFAMELVAGVPLTEYADSHGLGTDDRLRLVIDVCDAVDAAHAQGVIHRDLKPDNILVESAPGGPRVKVLDFGVAKLTERDVHFTTMRTEIGQIIGTLSYMSPEQVAGEIDRLDARTDVHALGAVLYELLTGERPFDLTGRPLPEAARIIRDEEPGSISRFDRAFRGDLETIIGRAMEKDPARRYGSAGELAGDLRRVLANKPIEARPPSAMYQLSKFTKRNKVLVGGVAATVAALAMGLVAATWFALDAADGRRLARWQTYRTAMTAASGAFSLSQPETAIRLLDEAPEEFRGWEHAHLSNRLESWERSFGSSDLAFVSADRGTGRLIGISARGAMTVWDAESGEEISASEIGFSVSSASRVTFGGELIVLTEAGEILRVEAESGRIVARYAESEQGWRSVALCDDGSRLAANSDVEVVVWETADGAEVVRHTPKTSRPIRSVRNIAIGPSGRRVAVTWTERDLMLSHVLEIDSGEIYSTKSKERPLGTVFSGDGSSIAVRMVVRNIHVHSFDEPRPVVVLEGHSGVVNDAVFLEDGRLVSVSDGVLRVQSPETKVPGASVRLPEPKSDVKLLTLGGSRVVTFARKEGRALLWDVDLTDADVLRHDEYVYNIAWSPDGRSLATQEFRGSMIRIWDVSRAAVAAEIGVPTPGSTPLAFSRNGGALLFSQRFGHNSSRLQIAETRGWTLTHTDITLDQAPGLLGDTRGLRLASQYAFSPDGRTLLRRIGSGKNRVWSLTRDGVDVPLAEGFQGGREVAWHPNGEMYASTSRAPEGADIWDARSGALLAVIDQPSTVFSVDFSPDGTRFVTGSEDGVVRIYDTDRFELITELNGHTSYVYVVRFSPDGIRLATGSGDRTVRIWDTVPRRLRRSSLGG